MNQDCSLYYYIASKNYSILNQFSISITPESVRNFWFSDIFWIIEMEHRLEMG